MKCCYFKGEELYKIASLLTIRIMSAFSSTRSGNRNELVSQHYTMVRIHWRGVVLYMC